MNYLGNKLRALRESQGLLLRQVAAYLEVDTAFISKVERGEKKASRDHVVKLSAFLSEDIEQLTILWLCDRIIDLVEDDPMAEEALKMALKNVKAEK